MASPIPRAAPVTERDTIGGWTRRPSFERGTGTLNHITDRSEPVEQRRRRDGRGLASFRWTTTWSSLGPVAALATCSLARRGSTGRALQGSLCRWSGRRWQETEEGGWADVWHYQGLSRWRSSPVSRLRERTRNWLGAHWDPMIYDDMRPGCYEQTARLSDMDRNHTEASWRSRRSPLLRSDVPRVRLPRTGPRVHSGLQRLDDRGVVRRSRPGSPHPADAHSALGSRAGGHRGTPVCRKGLVRGLLFRESGAEPELPSIHTTHWDPLFAACQETGTVVNVHIGSSSTFPVTSPDAPRAVSWR